MSGVNKVILIGRAGQDADLRALPSGKSVTNVGIATSKSWRDKSTGEKKEKTTWHRLVFFDKLGEIAGEYIKKGSMIYVEGEIDNRKYLKNGVETLSTEVICSKMQLLDSKDAGFKSEPKTNDAGFNDDFHDDDIPF